MGVSKTKDSVTGPLHLALDITNKCNYRCLHCYNASGENCVVDNELTDEEVLELINQISKIKPHTFCFCGGEPLLRKDLIVIFQILFLIQNAVRFTLQLIISGKPFVQCRDFSLVGFCHSFTFFYF